MTIKIYNKQYKNNKYIIRKKMGNNRCSPFFCTIFAPQNHTTPKYEIYNPILYNYCHLTCWRGVEYPSPPAYPCKHLRNDTPVHTFEYRDNKTFGSERDRKISHIHYANNVYSTHRRTNGCMGRDARFSCRHSDYFAIVDGGGVGSVGSCDTIYHKT